LVNADKTTLSKGMNFPLVGEFIRKCCAFRKVDGISGQPPGGGSTFGPYHERWMLSEMPHEPDHSLPVFRRGIRRVGFCGQ
jgi:hypothetical protein